MFSDHIPGTFQMSQSPLCLWLLEVSTLCKNGRRALSSLGSHNLMLLVIGSDFSLTKNCECLCVTTADEICEGNGDHWEKSWGLFLRGWRPYVRPAQADRDSGADADWYCFVSWESWRVIDMSTSPCSDLECSRLEEELEFQKSLIDWFISF